MSRETVPAGPSTPTVLSEWGWRKLPRSRPAVSAQKLLKTKLVLEIHLYARSTEAEYLEGSPRKSSSEKRSPVPLGSRKEGRGEGQVGHGALSSPRKIALKEKDEDILPSSLFFCAVRDVQVW